MKKLSNMLPIQSKAGLLIAALTFPLLMSGCNNAQPAKSTDSSTIHAPKSDASNSKPDSAFVTCPPFDPDKNICTMQYDPVCVKIKDQSGIHYKTAGNSCSACGTPEAIGFTQGECS